MAHTWNIVSSLSFVISFFLYFHVWKYMFLCFSLDDNTGEQISTFEKFIWSNITFLTNFDALSSNLVPDFTYLIKFSFYWYIKKSTFLTICSCSKILLNLKFTFYGLTIYEINVFFYADFEKNAQKIVSLILFKLLGWIHKNLM